MEADIRWLDDPQVFRVGQLPAHSDHPIYQDTEEAAEGRSSLVQSLDGTWEFAYSVNAKSRPVDFYQENTANVEFDTICVPGHKQGDVAFLVHFNIFPIAEILHSDTDAGLGHTQIVGNINGTDNTVLFLQH